MLLIIDNHLFEAFGKVLCQQELGNTRPDKQKTDRSDVLQYLGRVRTSVLKQILKEYGVDHGTKQNGDDRH